MDKQENTFALEQVIKIEISSIKEEPPEYMEVQEHEDYTSILGQTIKKEEIHNIEYDTEYFNIEKEPRQQLIQNIKQEKIHVADNYTQLNRVKIEKQDQKTQSPIHTGQKTFQCDQCDYKCSKIIFLKQHKLSHNAEKFLHCNQCNYKCIGQFALNQHKKIHINSTEQIFRCNLCDLKFIDRDELKQHKKTHTDQKEQTFNCNRVPGLDDDNHYKEYPIIKKEDIEQQDEDIGDEPLDKIKNLQILNTLPVYNCDQCNYLCSQLRFLEIHKQVHFVGKRGPFCCKRCDYKSNMLGDFLRHERTHSKDEPFRCFKCDYTSIYKVNLKRHELIHNTVVQTYSCDQCDFQSIGQYTLKQHKMIHEEKHFTCDQCSYRCSQLNVLQNHKLLHNLNIEQSYSCDRCPFKSNYKTSLHRHKKTHTKQKSIKILADKNSNRNSVI